MLNALPVALSGRAKAFRFLGFFLVNSQVSRIFAKTVASTPLSQAQERFIEEEVIIERIKGSVRSGKSGALDFAKVYL